MTHVRLRGDWIRYLEWYVYAALRPGARGFLLKDAGPASFRKVARDKTNSEITDELRILLGTVKSHIARLMAQVDARNRVEIAMWDHETNRMDNGSGRK